jgi:hypothetical protein
VSTRAGVEDVDVKVRHHRECLLLNVWS